MVETPRVHPAAAKGFSRGAETYARAPPEFPSAALDWLKDDLALCPGKVAVELGAGTGKFTGMLVAAGASIVAVEPIAEMRARLKEILPDVEALRGEAQRIPLATGTVDVVVCAQAFHWFANAEALAEIHRVLKPGGMLGLHMSRASIGAERTDPAYK